MRSFLAALRTLVLPYGRTSGQRIILDGENGKILVYNAANVLIAEVSAPQGFWTKNASNNQVSKLIGGSLEYVDNVGNVVQWLQAYELAFSNNNEITSTRLTYDPVSQNLNFSVRGNRIESNVPMYLIEPNDMTPEAVHPAIYTAGDVVNTASSGNIDGVTGETATDSVTFEAISGRTYELEWSFTLSPGTTDPAVGDRMIARIREDNATGTARALGRLFWEVAASLAQRPMVLRGRWTAAATGPKTVVGTVARETGTGQVVRFGATDRPSILTVRDVTKT